MVKYISDGTWFDKGTECILEDDFRPGMNSGIFHGMRTCENSAAEAGRPVGEKYEDGEMCDFDEFEVIA